MRVLPNFSPNMIPANYGGFRHSFKSPRPTGPLSEKRYHLPTVWPSTIGLLKTLLDEQTLEAVLIYLKNKRQVDKVKSTFLNHPDYFYQPPFICRFTGLHSGRDRLKNAID